MARRTAGVATLSLATTLTGLVFPGTAQAAVTCASGVWKAEYFANTTLTGTPKATVCDTAIAENYGLGDPAGVTLPTDNFGARWTTTRNFGSGGPFDFNVAVQDGARVYLDGVRKIDIWRNVTTTQKKTLRLTIPKGTHTLRVDFGAVTGAANIAFTYAPVIGATYDRVAPLTPTGLKAVYSASTLKTTLSWTRGAEMDLSGYRVYRRTGSTGTWAQLNSTTLTGTTYTDAPPATGEAYEYVIRALDRSGNLSPLSALGRVVSADKTPTAAPTGLTASYDVYGAHVRWSPVQGAASYELQRAVAASGPYYTIGTRSPSIDVSDPAVSAAQTYYYRVRAFDSAGNASAFSGYFLLGPAELPPPAPMNVTANGSVDRNTISWSYPYDATHRFHVYAADEATGPWTRLTDTSVSGFRYEDYTAPVKQLRHYRVQTITPLRTESGPSATVSATRTGDVTPPQIPYGIDAWDATDGVHLSWTANTDDTDHYVILRQPFLGAWEQIDAVWSVGYVDITATPGVQYAYTVRAVDASGNLSSMPQLGGTAIVYGKRLPLHPNPDAPASLTATLTETGKVKLDWTASAATDLSGYYVYRTTGQDSTGAYSVSPILTGTTFTDETVPAGRTYRYYIRAVSTNAKWSDYSPGAEITVPCPVTTTPAKPRFTAGDYYQGNVRLQWETGLCDQGNTVSYNLYRSRDGHPFTPENRIATGITEPTYSDPGLTGGTYYYVVTGVSADGTESAPSGTTSHAVPMS